VPIFTTTRRAWARAGRAVTARSVLQGVAARLYWTPPRAARESPRILGGEMAKAIGIAALLAGTLGCAHAPPASPAPIGLVVATIHKGHLVQPGYPLATLDAVLEAARPDLVLVEIRPEAFAQGHFEDGPFEMTYVVQRARARGIPVVGIDWWLDAELGSPEPSLPPAEQAALEAELAPIPEPGWATFAQVNGPEERARGAKEQNAFARLQAGNAAWNRRQAWFNHQALEAIARAHPQRVVAFVGYAHRPELEQALFSVGLHLLQGTDLTLGAVDAHAPAPADVVEAWKAGLARLQAQAAAQQGVARQKIEAKLRYFGVAVERQGRCCVDERSLEVP
jgi:hypothetical protein